MDGVGQMTTASSNPFSNLTLLAWDYSVTDREAALAQSAGFAISFRVRRTISCLCYQQQIESMLLLTLHICVLDH